MVTVAVPTSLAELTPEWLTQVLRSGGMLGDATVKDIQIEPVGQGVGILCQLARLTPVYEGDAGDAPASMIAKIATTDPQTRAMVDLFKFYEREVRFYSELAPEIDLNTPRAYHSYFDANSGNFVLLLEDLGGYRLGNQIESCSEADARTALTALTKIHMAWWNHPRLDELTWVPRINSDSNKMGLSLYPMAWQSFMQRVGDTIDTAIVPIGEQLGPKINAILDTLVDRPRTFCHGDYRLDNIFFQDGGPITVIDWQIASLASGVYDIGYFMSQSVDPEVRRACERDILTSYHEQMVAAGVTDYSLDQVIEDYRWTLLFCLVYPVIGGGLGDLSNERGHILATTMMRRATAAILDWNAGELLDRL